MTTAPGLIWLGSFKNRLAAERALASLGRNFRTTARKGDALAFVVSENSDGSLKVTQSRVLTAGDWTSAVLRVGLSWMVGFLGLFGMFTGGRREVQSARMRGSHVGSDEHSAHAILAEAGPNAAIALVRCHDEEMWHQVSEKAADRAIQAWTGTEKELLDSLDPGSEHDWVRSELGQSAN